jgi:hypothetical protein
MDWAEQVFKFDRYGVRVPTLIISPYVEKGRVLRTSGPVPYDHTSIIATLRKRFPELGGPLSNRDADAPDLDSALTLPKPINVGPRQINAPGYARSPAVAAAAQKKPLNNMQTAMVHLGPIFRTVLLRSSKYTQQTYKSRQRHRHLRRSKMFIPQQPMSKNGPVVFFKARLREPVRRSPEHAEIQENHGLKRRHAFARS